MKVQTYDKARPNSHFFLRNSAVRITKTDVSECIKSYWEKASFAFNDVSERILKNMSTPMCKLIELENDLNEEVLDNRQLHALARILRSIENEKKHMDYSSAQSLIIKLRPLIKHAELPNDIFDKVVQHGFNLLKPIDVLDNIANVFSKLYAANMLKNRQENAVTYIEKMLSKDPEQFSLFSQAFTANSDLFLREINRLLSEEQFNLIVKKCIENSKFTLRSSL